MTNQQAQAYAVVAAKNLGMDSEWLKKLDAEMYHLFDEYTGTEIERKAQKVVRL